MPKHTTSDALKLPAPATLSALRTAALQSLQAQSPSPRPGYLQSPSPRPGYLQSPSPRLGDWRSELSATPSFSPRPWESPSPVGGVYAAKAPKLAAGKLTQTAATPRIPIKVPEAISGYRPGLGAVPPNPKVGPVNSEQQEVHAMLQLIGYKCAEKFSKPRDAFNFIDMDKDGQLSPTEVRFFFRRFNLQPEKADTLFTCLDVDNTGSIGLSRFMQYIWPYITPGSETAQAPWQLTTERRQNNHELVLGRNAQEVTLQQRLLGHGIPQQLREARIRLAQQLQFKYRTLTRAFLTLDQDSDGHLSRQDMEGLFERNGVPQSIREQFFEFVDQDHSGTIDIKEFAALFDRDLDGLRLRI